MIDHFDWLASIYDRIFEVQDATRLRELLKLPITGWMLDAGGGTGRVSSQFSPLVGKLIICDPSQKMLQQARKKGNLSTVQSRVERLPFSDESFERILVVDSFHHFRNQQQAIHNLLRALKPGGRIVIEEPDIDHVAVKIVAIIEKLLLMRSRFYSPKQIADLFLVNGRKAFIEHDGKFTAWIVVDKF